MSVANTCPLYKVRTEIRDWRRRNGEVSYAEGLDRMRLGREFVCRKRRERISLEEKDVWSLLPALLSFEQQLPLPSVRYELALNIL